jgi:hypothetical protein
MPRGIAIGHHLTKQTVLARLLIAGQCLRTRVELDMDPEAGPWLDVLVAVEMEG